MQTANPMTSPMTWLVGTPWPETQLHTPQFEPHHLNKKFAHLENSVH